MPFLASANRNAGGTTSGGGASTYTITQVSSGGVDHKWPSINTHGDIVWSQQINGKWQVFKNGTAIAPLDAVHNYFYPDIADNGDILYLKDNVGLGAARQVILNRGGVESVIEFSSLNVLTGDHRDAGQHFGIASNGTTISYYDFCCVVDQVWRFNVSGIGQLPGSCAHRRQ